MHKPRFRPDKFCKMRQKSDHIMLYFPLDRVDFLDIECRRATLLPDDPRRFFRDNTKFRHRITGMRLDLEPDPVLRLRRPDRNHFRAAIAGNHRLFLLGLRSRSMHSATKCCLRIGANGGNLVGIMDGSAFEYG